VICMHAVRDDTSCVAVSCGVLQCVLQRVAKCVAACVAGTDLLHQVCVRVVRGGPSSVAVSCSVLRCVAVRVAGPNLFHRVQMAHYTSARTKTHAPKKRKEKKTLTQRRTYLFQRIQMASYTS